MKASIVLSSIGPAEAGQAGDPMSTGVET